MDGDGSVVFSDGWADFVSDHGVKVFDVLVFRYVGDSSFEVTVFDKGSCCEREGTHFVSNGSCSSPSSRRTRTTSCSSTLHGNNNTHGSKCKEEIVVDSSDSEEIDHEEEEEPEGEIDHEEEQHEEEDYSWEGEGEEEEEESEAVEEEIRSKRGRPRKPSNDQGNILLICYTKLHDCFT